MSYQVLARKWRPQNFKQMVGQEHVLRALIHALESQRLHHAYLFTGTRGVGKTTIGRILAKCLSCDKGITAEPCGTCGACTSIVEGRYVDLIEIDAASRTKVEDMRELLDNVQYAPTEGRFKIYLIDEVHMLSQSSFNALLKTLEEPPEHVKFLFATTDPQKLPVTILSRCLQFNLKNMSPERIVGHLQHILSEEQVTAEDPALWALARAADGSMRDALSLTDQAIAYGNSVLSESGVSAMLGTIDQKRVYRILAALIANDAKMVLDEVSSLAEFSPDYQSVLASLISILHRIAVEQAVPGATDNTMGDQSEVCEYARSLSAEDLQLFYQIALVSRNDLTMHPDPRAGLEMALIRMLAFQLDRPPVEQGELANISTAKEINEASDALISESSASVSVAAELEPEPELAQEPIASVETHVSESGSQDVSAQQMPEPPPIESYGYIPESDDHSPEDFSAPGSIAPTEQSGQGADQGLSSKKKTELRSAAGQAEPEQYESSGEGLSASGLVEQSVNPEMPNTIAPVEQANIEASGAAIVDSVAAPPAAEKKRDDPFGTDSVAGSPDLDKQVDEEAVSSPLSDAPVGSASSEHESWPVRSMQVAVSGMTQNLMFNMSLDELDDETILYVETGHYRLLNSNHEKRIVEAMQAFLGNSKPLKFVDGLLAGQETPMMWRERRAGEMLQAATEEAGRDPNVKQLIEAFDASIVDGSIKALGDLV